MLFSLLGEKEKVLAPLCGSKKSEHGTTMAQAACLQGCSAYNVQAELVMTQTIRFGFF